MLDFNPTLAIVSFIGFIIGVPLLARVLVKPVLHTIEERVRRTQGAEEEAKAIAAHLGADQGAYTAALDALRREGAALRAQRRLEAEKQASALLEEKTAELRSRAGEREAELARQIADATKKLESDVAGFADTAAKRLLGRPV